MPTKLHLDKVIICADDFGQNEPISQGIINLVKAKKLNAVSCMTNTSAWTTCAHELTNYSDCQWGLHFNLTHGMPLSDEWKKCYNNSLPSLKSLIIKTQCRLLKKEVIYAELQAQYQQFVQLAGFVPKFIDGHQHIQQFPQIRDVLLDFINNLDNKPSWIRLSTAGQQYLKPWWKYTALWLLGGRKFSKQLKINSIKHNSNLLGVYDFSSALPYENHFKYFLEQIQANSIIMCHPGLASEDEQDPIRHQRFKEYKFFKLADYKFIISTK